MDMARGIAALADNLTRVVDSVRDGGGAAEAAEVHHGAALPKESMNRASIHGGAPTHHLADVVHRVGARFGVSRKGAEIRHTAIPEEWVSQAVARLLTPAGHLARVVDGRRSAVVPTQSPQVRGIASFPQGRVPVSGGERGRRTDRLTGIVDAGRTGCPALIKFGQGGHGAVFPHESVVQIIASRR